MRGKISIVALSGGIGNQLFQLFAAHHLSAEAQILIESDSHKPQRDFKQNLVVEELTILSDINSSNVATFPVFIQRIASLNLRSSLDENKGFARWIRRFSTGILLRTFLTLRYKRFFKLLTPTTVDEFPILDGARNIFLNGYFQNKLSVSSPSSKKLIKTISLNMPDDAIQSWISRAGEAAPVILHYRLGDYRSHPGMGVLDPSYFSKAIAEIRASKPNAEVWVFSDEPRVACDLLLATGISQIRAIPEFSPGETLELMRHGSAYVISNSTFSWWGAVLKYDESAEVWAPLPWFKSQKSPKNIYGENWHLVGAWSDLQLVEPSEELEE